MYGCSDKTVLFLTFLTSYLSNRSQSVSFNGTLSDALPISVGVPRGSILGPLFYLLFINDLPLASENSKMYMYADDTTAQVVGPNIRELETKLNDDVTSILSWCENNNMCINSEKTKVMVIGTSQKNLELTNA